MQENAHPMTPTLMDFYRGEEGAKESSENNTKHVDLLGRLEISLQRSLETCSCYIPVTYRSNNFLQRQPGPYLQCHQLLPEVSLRVKLQPFMCRRKSTDLVLEICPLP